MSIMVDTIATNRKVWTYFQSNLSDSVKPPDLTASQSAAPDAKLRWLRLSARFVRQHVPY